MTDNVVNVNFSEAKKRKDEIFELGDLAAFLSDKEYTAEQYDLMKNAHKLGHYVFCSATREGVLDEVHIMKTDMARGLHSLLQAYDMFVSDTAYHESEGDLKDRKINHEEVQKVFDVMGDSLNKLLDLLHISLDDVEIHRTKVKYP